MRWLQKGFTTGLAITLGGYRDIFAVQEHRGSSISRGFDDLFFLLLTEDVDIGEGVILILIEGMCH